MPNKNRYKDPRIAVPILAALIGGIFLLISSSPQLPTSPIFKEMGVDIDTDGNYEISWESSKRATKYTLQEDMNYSFTSPRTVYGGSETKKYIYGKSDGDYYYRVRGCNDAGESDWSPLQKISVVPFHSATPTTTPRPTPLVATPTPTKTPKLMPTPTSTAIITPTPISIVTTQTPTSKPTPTTASSFSPTSSTKSTPTPTMTPTPTPPVTVKITEPKDGGDFSLGRSTIVGTLSNVPDDQHLWIVLSKSNGRHYPFDELYIRSDTWEVISYGVGEDNMEKEDGDTFIIGAYLLDERANEEFEQYVEEIEDRKWGGLDSLPEGATKCDEIEVIGRRVYISELPTPKQTPIPPPTTGAIRIDSSPSGATVELDGNGSLGPISATPATIPGLDPGYHTIKLTLAGYQDWTGSAHVTGGETTNVDATLIPTPTITGFLSVTSSPTGADIAIDGRPIGEKTPHTVPIDPGPHTIKLTLEGYQDWTGSAHVTGGETTDVHATFDWLAPP